MYMSQGQFMLYCTGWVLRHLYILGLNSRTLYVICNKIFIMYMSEEKVIPYYRTTW